jgi:hypothetical protein
MTFHCWLRLFWLLCSFMVLLFRCSRSVSTVFVTIIILTRDLSFVWIKGLITWLAAWSLVVTHIPDWSIYNTHPCLDIFVTDLCCTMQRCWAFSVSFLGAFHVECFVSFDYCNLAACCSSLEPCFVSIVQSFAKSHCCFFAVLLLYSSLQLVTFRISFCVTLTTRLGFCALLVLCLIIVCTVLAVFPCELHRVCDVC